MINSRLLEVKAHRGIWIGYWAIGTLSVHIGAAYGHEWFTLIVRIDD